jgi:ribosomal protein S18 acetylase RimI-like enzyme
MITIVQAETPEHIEETRRIFREYESWLGLSLCFQNFEEELRDLPGKYAPTEGRLFLAIDGDSVAGSIAMRKLEDGVCEMKRLFVRENYQGCGVGRMLIERLISEARVAGYRKMRLDTFPPKMAKAVRLYESYGFREIPPYYDNPHGETLYMELQL